MSLLPAKATVDTNIGGAVNDDMNGLVTVDKLWWQIGRLKVAFKISTCQAGPEKQKVMGALYKCRQFEESMWVNLVSTFVTMSKTQQIQPRARKKCFPEQASLLWRRDGEC